MTTPRDRPSLLRRGLWLEATVIVWNVLEGLVAVAAGLIADSVALIGFGIDSFIEVTSAAVVFWRLWTEHSGRAADRAERREQTASRIAGALLFLLAAYIVIDATRRLLGHGEPPQESFVGMALTGLSLLIMPVLGWAKLRTADALGSGALRADAYETITCAWLSLTTLLGLSINAVLGWTWADPLAALLIVPLILREGWEGWTGGCHKCGE